MKNLIIQIALTGIMALFRWFILDEEELNIRVFGKNHSIHLVFTSGMKWLQCLLVLYFPSVVLLITISKMLPQFGNPFLSALQESGLFVAIAIVLLGQGFVRIRKVKSLVEENAINYDDLSLLFVMHCIFMIVVCWTLYRGSVVMEDQHAYLVSALTYLALIIGRYWWFVPAKKINNEEETRIDLSLIYVALSLTVFAVSFLKVPAIL